MWRIRHLLLFAASNHVIHADSTIATSTYRTRSVAALEALQAFYNTTSGLWNTCGWWNAANCLTVVADLAAVDPTALTLDTATSVFENTFAQAPLVNPQEDLFKISIPGLVRTVYGQGPKERVNEAAGFTDAYHDDDGWWALGWIAAYDLTRNASYLETAMGLFEAMSNNTPTYCGGGIYWAEDNSYVNAIANELYLSVAAHIATRVPASQSQNGMINADNTINDGLTTSYPCVNNNGTVWSYNQGVILGALVELNRAAPNATLLTTASAIALATINNLTDSLHVLHDPCEPDCGADGAQFKGIFMRNLRALQNVRPHSKFAQVIQASANSIWSFDRDPENQFSDVWSGPFLETANCSTQSSAMDALVAAIAL